MALRMLDGPVAMLASFALAEMKLLVGRANINSRGVNPFGRPSVGDEFSVKDASSTICSKDDDGESVWNFVAILINLPMDRSAWD